MTPFKDAAKQREACKINMRKYRQRKKEQKQKLEENK